jgi:hypothetical protein
MASALQAVGASAPIGDFRFVDFVTARIRRFQTRGAAGGTVDVHDTAAAATDQMVMVVADAIFESRGGSCGLDAAEEPMVDEQREGVVDRLERNRTDIRADPFGHAIRGDVRLTGDDAHDREPLRSDVNAALAQERGRVAVHPDTLDQDLELFKGLIDEKVADGPCHF